MVPDSALRTWRTATIWIAVAAGAFLLWKLRYVVLTAFATILLAIVLDIVATLVSRIPRVSRGWSLAAATLLLFAAIAGCLWEFGASLSMQFSNLVQKTEAGAAALGALLREHGINESILSKGAGLFENIVPAVLSSSLTVTESSVIAVISAIYLAVHPRVYRNGAAALIAKGSQPKAREALRLAGAALRLWVMGQFILMVMVGLLSYVAALVLGLPNPIALALIAGLTEIVPYLGPFIGAVPALLAGLAHSFTLAIWTAVAYLGIHTIEGYLVGPLLQRWFIRIPPVVVLISILASQAVFGLAGVILAAPIAVAVFTAVKFFYVGGTLEQHVDLPTEAPI